MNSRQLVRDRETLGTGLLLLALRRWIWVLALCAVVPALIALVVTISRPEVYVAKASLLAEVTATSDSDREVKLGRMVSLVQSEAIADEVFGQHAERLAPTITTSAELLVHVKGTLGAIADLIQISVATHDAGLSVAIANAWARSYEDLVTASVAEVSADTRLETLKADLATSKAAYDEEEQALAGFVSDNSLGELDRAIEERGKIIAALQEQHVEAKLAELRQLRDDLVRMQRVLADLRALQDYLDQSDAEATKGAVLALELLRTEAFASSVGESPWDLQLQLGVSPSPDASAEALMRDTALLRASLEARIGQLDAQIEERSAGLVAGLVTGTADERLTKLRDELERLQAQREMERSRLTELTATRDLAWQLSLRLTGQAAEESLVSKVPAARVRLVSPAASAARGESADPLQATAVAGVAGLMFGLGVAFVVEYLRWERRRVGATTESLDHGSGGSPASA
jgi:capsular polysaccharide biosynthesis protein